MHFIFEKKFSKIYGIFTVFLCKIYIWAISKLSLLINLTKNATHNILLFSLLFHVGRKLDKSELVGRDGASFPWWCRLRLDQVTARDCCRRFPSVSRLRERFDILGRSWLQAWLPKLLKIYIGSLDPRAICKRWRLVNFHAWCLLIMANSLPFNEYWIIDALVTEYNSQIWITIWFYYNHIIKYNHQIEMK